MKKRLMYALPFLAFCMMMVVGCRKQTGEKENQQNTAVETRNAFENAETYTGTIPCADCEGIKMVLKVSSDYKSFELSSTYKGKNEEPFVETGNLNTERGFENDKDATVFILNGDKPEKDQSYWVRYSNDTSKIHMLSRDKKLIVSKLNYTLDKQ